MTHRCSPRLWMAYACCISSDKRRSLGEPVAAPILSGATLGGY